MLRYSRLLAVVLALGVLMTIPMVADTAEVEVEKEGPPVTFDFSEPLFTPMEGAQEQGVITVEDLRRIHFLRLCDPEEVEIYCPGCFDCIITATKVTCIC